MKQKHFYYIIVQSEGQAKFVTKIDNSTKTARWEANGKPLAVSKYYAEDVAFCLNLNYYPAFVLQSLYEIPEQIFYKKNRNPSRNCDQNLRQTDPILPFRTPVFRCRQSVRDRA